MLGCARMLHLPAAQHLVTQQATQPGSLAAKAVGVQCSQNGEDWLSVAATGYRLCLVHLIIHVPALPTGTTEKMHASSMNPS
ncbi:hypothetical protein WJX79_010407 [Trebouxia sp. C0005]